MAEGTGTPGAGTPAANGIQTGVNGASPAPKTAEKKPVKYGKTADAYLESLEAAKDEQEQQEKEPEPAEPENTDKRATLKKLVSNDYKDEFEEMVGERVKSALDKRFKNDTSKAELKAANERWDKIAPALAAMQKKYGTAEGDIDALVNAYLADDDVYSDRAIEQGTTVDAVRESDKRDADLKKLQEENKRLKDNEQAEKRKTETQRIIDNWHKEAEDLKKDYPDFNFEAEIKNPKFTRFLESGESVRDAFEYVHKNELFKAFGEKVASETEQKIASGIAANARRPVEGASQSQASVLTVKDVANMSRQQREALLQRAAMGEKVYL